MQSTTLLSFGVSAHMQDSRSVQQKARSEIQKQTNLTQVNPHKQRDSRAGTRGAKNRMKTDEPAKKRGKDKTQINQGTNWTQVLTIRGINKGK